MREDKIAFAFPYTNPEQFKNSPYLIKSKEDNGNLLHANTQVFPKRKLKENDLLFFMSDAIALWFTEEIYQGRQPWNSLLNCFKEKNETFIHWLSEMKKNKLIKNDDSTLLIVELK